MNSSQHKSKDLESQISSLERSFEEATVDGETWRVQCSAISHTLDELVSVMPNSVSSNRYSVENRSSLKTGNGDASWFIDDLGTILLSTRSDKSYGIHKETDTEMRNSELNPCSTYTGKCECDRGGDSGQTTGQKSSGKRRVLFSESSNAELSNVGESNNTPKTYDYAPSRNDKEPWSRTFTSPTQKCARQNDNYDSLTPVFNSISPIMHTRWKSNSG